MIEKKRSLKVFLCHSSQDKQFVRQIYKRLIDDGVDAWLDEEKLLAGQYWQDEIPKAVRDADVIVVFITKNSINKNGYIQKEIKMALEVADEKAEGTIFIIPARLDDSPVPERFSNIQWVNLFESTGYEKLITSLSLREEQLGIVPLDRVKELFDDQLLNYREDILLIFFRFIKANESFYFLGMSGVGKTRLLDFVFGNDFDVFKNDLDRERVKNKYLGKDKASQTWLIYVDMNRMGSNFDVGFLFFELLLHALLVTSYRQGNADEILREKLFWLHSEVAKNKDDLLAIRYFEIAVVILCQVYKFKLILIFDEFDNAYATLPESVLTKLRTVRDLNKNNLSFGLFLRNLPERIRNTKDNENFYELISRNIIGIGPYSKQDTNFLIETMEKRYEYNVSSDLHERLYIVSGGHPGILHAFFVLLRDNEYALSQLDNFTWFVEQEIIKNELRKIWAGMLAEEQEALKNVAKGDLASISSSMKKLLLAKGIIKPMDGRISLFSPLLQLWLVK